MKRLLGLAVGLFAVLLLAPAQASASTLTDCVTKQEVCVSGDGRSLISQGQQAKLERQIGGDPIYLVVAPSGSSGYNSSMNEIISALSGHEQFTVGFLDTRLQHFGAHVDTPKLTEFPACRVPGFRYDERGAVEGYRAGAGAPAAGAG